MPRFSYLTRAVWLLSLISLFTDLASEMLYPIMPLYLQSIGFSVFFIGLLEGVAEAVTCLSKGYFGQWSDRLGRRVPFVRWGYGLSALSKPLLAVLATPAWVLLARTVDRVGKGLRTGARDALLSDEATPENKAKVFGFHRSMDTLGAVLGPTAALLWLAARPGQFRPLFLWAFVPGLLAVAFTLRLGERPAAPLPRPVRPFWASFSYWRGAPPAAGGRARDVRGCVWRRGPGAFRGGVCSSVCPLRPVRGQHGRRGQSLGEQLVCEVRYRRGPGHLWRAGEPGGVSGQRGRAVASGRAGLDVWRGGRGGDRGGRLPGQSCPSRRAVTARHGCACCLA